jgi:ATP-dependent RNA helicase HelY
MSTPAERYAASRARTQARRTRLGAFASTLPFPLDDFQEESCQALEAGRSVLVAAPTGAGKTVVGEFAVDLALESGTKCFYTTPIKALSNQKFHDLVRRYGPANVGLLTGDNVVNGDAPVVVMTTEVLRNMLYAGSPALVGLRYVVMDEVHYLADRFRGAVWEEVIIHLPDSVDVVALSATVSNAEEFGDWLTTVRGDTAVIVSERRPVPLWQYVMTEDQLHDLFIDDEQTVVNPELVRMARAEQQLRRAPAQRPQRGSRRPRSRLEPSRLDEVVRLDREGLLPAIIFIFSRAGCDAAVEQVLRSGIRLTSTEERTRIETIVDERSRSIPDDDLTILGWAEWRDALARGVASHHAGLLPTFKEIVEELFAEGLVKVVFATETLALGINMPARSVVLERLVKWNGDAHVDIKPGEYTQLTGRAGRRGIDVEGHAVVAWHQGLDPQSLAGLASTRTYPLNSSFRPSYNMAVNLVRAHGRDRARELLETSFAQFQADRAVVGIAQQIRRNETAMQDYFERMTCHLGDFSEYSRLRREISEREAELARGGAAQRRAAVAASLEALRTGDIVLMTAGRRRLPAVVIDPGSSPRFDTPRPQVMSLDRRVKRVSATEVGEPLEPIGRLTVPRNFNPRDARMRRDLAAQLAHRVPDHAPTDGGRRRNRSEAADDPVLHDLRAAMRRHPCQGCDEREAHARWAERYWRSERENRTLERRSASRTSTIARTFDRVCGVLETLGYLDGDTVTPAGERLTRLYNELDLVAAEALNEGLWNGLRPEELAACVSALVFESRQPDDAEAPSLPGGRVQEVLGRMVRLWARLEGVEQEHGVSFLREPDLGFAWAVHQWSSGRRLEAVLQESELSPGDFVRWCKQVIDLLGQIATAADAGGSPEVAASARSAMDGVRRGVVAYSASV